MCQLSETVKTESATKKSFFKNVKSEFKKASWPKKEELAKQTGLVIVVAVVLGAIISVIDLAIQFGVDKIIG